MAPLDAWLSPPAQQALIAGLFLASGWIVVGWQNRRRDERLRRAREADIQRALLAEIRAHVVALEQQVPSPEDALRLIARIRSRDFVPTLPQEANDRIFQAVISDIHLLPAPVIDPIVLYYRLLSVMAALATDLRRFARHDGDKGAQMMADYLSLMEETRDHGIQAIRVLTESLRGGTVAVERMLAEDEAALARAIGGRIGDELAGLRARFEGAPAVSNRSSDRRDL